MNFPDPIFTVERLYQCLAFIYQPEPTSFVSLLQVSPREEINKHGFNQPFGNIVQIKVLKSIQKDFSGYIVIYIKKTEAVFFFSLRFSLLTFLSFILCCLIQNDDFETKTARFRS